MSNGLYDNSEDDKISENELRAGIDFTYEILRYRLYTLTIIIIIPDLNNRVKSNIKLYYAPTVVLLYRFSAIKTGNLFLSQQQKDVQNMLSAGSGLDKKLRPTDDKFTQHTSAVIIKFVETRNNVIIDVRT